MKVARVFPTKTNMSPIDCDSYFGLPPLWSNKYDEVHISCVFTWDKDKAIYLKKQWEVYVKNVKIGGCAFDNKYGEFEPGKYIKEGVTFTSRGCIRKCPWCFVSEREGNIKEFEIKSGNIIYDNNLLACSKQHIEKVIEMLKTQKKIRFMNLDPRLIDDCFIDSIRGLRIFDLWLSMDYKDADKPLKKAIKKLKKYFPKYKLRCYVLIGYKDDNIEMAKARLIKAWNIGTYPFAMLYRDIYGFYPEPEEKWKNFQRDWDRPAIYKSLIKINESNGNSG